MIKRIFNTVAVAAALVIGGTSCVGDLTVTPIDPSIVLPEDVLNTEDAFNALLAKCYQGLACSSSEGEGGGPDISGVDGGYGQYLRAMFHLQCLATDEAVCCWNDNTLQDIHGLCWGSADIFIAAGYYRVFFQVGLCNEFIRKANESQIEGFTHKAEWIAEARALRLLSYYHAIDLFGNVPFFTEENSVGSEGPEQVSRAWLWDWMVGECKELIEGSDLKDAKATEYGRINKESVQMILAKLYLNAEVWKGEDHYEDCAAICQALKAKFPALHANYLDLFSADNHKCVISSTYPGTEIFFAVPQDGVNIRSYGATNYIIFASTGGDMDAAGDMGISSGWGGLTLTKAFVDKFDEETDKRANFYTAYGKEIPDIMTYTSGGYKSMKYRNINADGTPAQEAGFVDTDFPVFRTADAYLMLAECAARGKADKSEGLAALNAVRVRAGLAEASDLTLQGVLDERARELYHELVRRQDLVRFNQFTTADYLWDYKGGEKEGTAVDAKYNVYPLCSSDVNANSNLKQNPGY